VVHDGETIDFTAPYPRKTFRDAILEGSGIDIDKENTADKLRKAMQAKGYDAPKRETQRALLDGLFKDSFRKRQVQPIFITHYPEVLKPLAKKSETRPGTTDSFQLVVAGYELSNSYTELNDPVYQRARFAEQTALAKAGDEEAMSLDEDFIEALEYGMPPATGTGIGIDRFVALLTGSHSIREITPYPLMKPRRDV
jgi:lysyl-tRNA synthetase class 2